MGACFGKTKNNDEQNQKNHNLIITSLNEIKLNLTQILDNNKNDLSKIDKHFESLCKRNEEATLANREQIDYLMKNCVSFGKRIKDLESNSTKQI